MARRRRKNTHSTTVQENAPAPIEEVFTPAVPSPEAVEKFAERLMECELEVPLNECFQMAADFAAYMTAVRNKSMVLGSRYVPGAVKALGQKAVEGDIEAAKVLFDFLGFRVKTPVAQATTMVQVNVPTLRDIIEIDEEGRIVSASS